MKNIIFTLCLISIFSCQPKKENPKKPIGDQPAIVVGIVVDQMKQDYLLRYYDRFGEGGFKRLVSNGYLFKNAHYNYAPTKTAPGHASIYTGTTPANHGIIANDWYSRVKGLHVNCVSDLNESNVGGTKSNGLVSPRNLTASTITDELRVSTNFKSKVIAISLKDRGAVLPAGHNPNGAYWMDGKTAEFMTSTYYTSELPAWVSTFNEKKIASSYMENTWNTLLPISDYNNDDDTPYERLYKGLDSPTFPYDFSEIVKNEGINIIKSSPYGNTIIVDFAIDAIENEQLGEDQYTDFLALSFSSTDYIGHAFGPNSVEVEDTYLRFDLEIKRLLDYLDSKYPENYQIFLTSDHGVAAVPQYQIDNKVPGGYFNAKETREKLTEMTQEALGKGDWIENISNEQIFLNRDLIEKKGKDLSYVQSVVKRIVLKFDHIDQAFSSSEIEKRSGSDRNRIALENGYNTKLSGDILLIIKPGFLSGGYNRRGTTHGSGNNYDTHIPLIFYGKDIPQGNSVRRVAITDIVPSLSMLLNISLPSSSTGDPLLELFN